MYCQYIGVAAVTNVLIYLLKILQLKEVGKMKSR